MLMTMMMARSNGAPGELGSVEKFVSFLWMHAAVEDEKIDLGLGRVALVQVDAKALEVGG